MKFAYSAESGSSFAFTLVELLVVISIIGLLAGLAIPSISGAMLQGKKADALNQLKQLGLLAVAYSSDNNWAWPTEGGEGLQSFSALGSASNATAWYNVLPAMINPNLCASNYRSNPKGFYDKGSFFYSKAAKYPSSKTASAYFAFGINSQLDGMRLVALSKPSRTALFAEARLPNETTLAPTGGKSDSLGQPKVRDSRFVCRYSGSGIVTFCDGHSESIKAKTLADVLNPNTVIWEQVDPAVASQ